MLRTCESRSHLRGGIHWWSVFKTVNSSSPLRTISRLTRTTGKQDLQDSIRRSSVAAVADSGEVPSHPTPQLVRDAFGPESSVLAAAA